MPDLIQAFLDYTNGSPSPERFRLWAGISAIAGALERRVWVRSAGDPVYPNLYVLLVAPPGVGKYIIHEVQTVWKEARCFKVAPHSTTKASLVDSLNESLRTITIPGEIIEYHSLQIAAEEFGVLVPTYDLEYLSHLNNIFNNPSYYSEKRRSVDKGETMTITNPQLNIIAGTQPGYLGTLFPEEAWTMGTASRLLMIYAGEPIQVELFPEKCVIAARMQGREKFVESLQFLSKLHGEFDWDPRAVDAMRAWYKAGFPPAPTHSKLLYYGSRRILHIMKLIQIAAISRCQDLKITLDDLATAREWILMAEQQMPNVFYAMAHKSDFEIMQEVHIHMHAIWAKKQEPIHESRMYTYLSTRVTSDRAPRIVDVMERGGLIRRIAGTKTPEGLYIPSDRKEPGVE